MAPSVPSSILRSVLCVSALLPTACGGGSETAPAAGAPQAPAAASRGTEPADRVVEARRIVSLAPAFTETLVALGAGDRIVGIGTFDPDVPGRPALPRLGDAFTVSREALAALEADLVLVNARGPAEVLRGSARGATVLAPPTDRLDDVRALVLDLARRTGREPAGRALLGEIDAALSDARRRAEARRAAGGTTPRVLVVVQRSPLHVAGAGGFLHDLLLAVGAENAAGDLADAWPTLSAEAAVARAPDVVLDASVGDADTEAGRRALVDAWRRFPSIPAVRDGRVVAVREDALFRAGPRIPEALRILERLVHGGDRR